MSKAKEPKVFAVHNKSGQIVRLVEADSKKQVKAHIDDGTTIVIASALTVARAKLEVERAS